VYDMTSWFEIDFSPGIFRCDEDFFESQCLEAIARNMSILDTNN
jgi:hypothetical protein